MPIRLVSPSVARRGFGLIEMMIVIAIVAILAAIALPSYRQTMASNRVATQSDDLVNALNLARTEAVARSRFVTLCAANTAQSACNNSTDWSNGWIVFADDYTDIGTLGNGDELLRVRDTKNAQTGLTTASKYVSFDRQGKPRSDAGSGVLTFVIKPASCTANQPLKRTLQISPAGSTSVVSGNCP